MKGTARRTRGKGEEESFTTTADNMYNKRARITTTDGVLTLSLHKQNEHITKVQKERMLHVLFVYYPRLVVHMVSVHLSLFYSLVLYPLLPLVPIRMSWILSLSYSVLFRIRYRRKGTKKKTKNRKGCKKNKTKQTHKPKKIIIKETLPRGTITSELNVY